MSKEEQIQKYLGHQLTESERKAFEHDLETDSELAVLFEEHKKLKIAIQNSDYQSSKLYLKSIEKNQFGRKKRMMLNWISVAASLVIGFSFIFFNQQNKTSDLFNVYCEAKQNTFQPVVRGQVNSKAFLFYEDENYKAASLEFESMNLENPEDLEKLNLYLGISYLFSEQPTKALKVLESLTPTKEVQYYLMWSFIKLEDNENAKRVNQSLITSHPKWKKEELETVQKSLNNKSTPWF